MINDEWALCVKPCVTEWINRISDICISESRHTGIYPSITIAQTILESHAGTSNLATEHYNFFGMTMPERLVGEVAVFWDGMIYKRANYFSNRSWADYLQAGSYDSGIVMSIRHYGMNFWKSPNYKKKGVLNHISSGLTVEEAKEDAKKQLAEIALIYAPPTCEENLGYEEKILNTIEIYNLWKYDEKFLALGGWNGVSPYA